MTANPPATAGGFSLARAALAYVRATGGNGTGIELPVPLPIRRSWFGMLLLIHGREVPGHREDHTMTMTMTVQSIEQLPGEYFATFFDGGVEWHAVGGSPAQAALSAWNAYTSHEAANAVVRAELGAAHLHIQPWPSRLSPAASPALV